MTVTRRLEKEILKQSPTGGKLGFRRTQRDEDITKKGHLLPNHNACLK